MDRDHKVCIIGMGYVGLTLAVAMAKKGFIVHGVEIDKQKLESMQNGTPFFYETDLESNLRSVINRGLLTFSREIPLKPYGVYIITIGTPLMKDTKVPRFDMIEKVSSEISKVMNPNSIVILRSTVAVGTTREIVIPILEQKNRNPQVAFCSERTLEGKALEEILLLPQVIGAIDERSLRRASVIFHEITPAIVEVSSIETAEIIKLLDNVYRDTQFALSNEISEVCEYLGINAYETIKAANLGYQRTNIALPGYVGGPCLEKDPYILEYSLRNYEHKPRLIMYSRTLHENLQARIANRILNWTLGNDLDPKKIKVVLLGMAFKGIPETDDLRGAPSISMIKELRDRGFANLYGHDYLVSNRDIAVLKIKPVHITNAFSNTSIVIFMNNNPNYKKLNLVDEIKKMLKPAFFMDSWNMFDSEQISLSKEICYGSIGNKTIRERNL
ncbi:nucleotide sugar dehydrogenase [Chloroflexota bacterium]